MKIETRIKPSTTTNSGVWSMGRKFVISAGVTLKRTRAKPIAITKAKMSAPRPISVETSSSSPSSCAA